MILRDLTLRLRALLTPRRTDRDLTDELDFHLQREAFEQRAKGLDPSEAATRARVRFGSTALAADLCRDSRGTAWVDNSVRDVRFAIRSFRRAPGAAFAIVAMLSLGLGLIAVVFTYYSSLSRIAGIRNPEEVFRMRRVPGRKASTWSPYTRTEYERLQRETDVFANVAGGIGEVKARIEGRMARGALVTGNFFAVLGVRAALGRTLDPSDDNPFASRPAIVMSHWGWIKFFGRSAVVGKVVQINGLPYEIVGVLREDAHSLGLDIITPDFWAPSTLDGRFQSPAVNKDDVRFVINVGRLKPGVTADVAAAQLTAWTRTLPAFGRKNAFGVVELAPILDPIGPESPVVLASFAALFLVFGLVLAIAWVNVTHLLLARGMARQRELGVRLSLGASPWHITRQLLTEHALLALCAAGGGFLISRWFLHGAIYLALSFMPAEMAEQATLAVPQADWRVGALLLGGALFSTLVIGALPILQATRIELVRVLRGELVRNYRPGRVRHVLIGVQVGASTTLLVCAGVFLRSAYATSTADVGFRTADTLIVKIGEESKRGALLDAMARHPLVERMAASAATLADQQAQAFVYGTGSESVGVEYQFVSPTYFDLLDIRLVSGRAFTGNERGPEAAVAIVSEAVARKLWPARNALGQTFRFKYAAGPYSTRFPDDLLTPLPKLTFTVVGVVRTKPRPPTESGIAYHANPGVFLPIAVEHAGTSITARVHGDPDRARQELLSALTKIDPALEDIRTVRAVMGLERLILRIAFGLTLVIGGLALLLTLASIFSVLSHVIAQRTHEIGIRLALGGTARSVTRLMVRQSLIPIVGGIVGGAALAGALAKLLMASPLALSIGTLVRVHDPLAYAGPIACILAACLLAASMSATRATRVDITNALRRD